MHASSRRLGTKHPHKHGYAYMTPLGNGVKREKVGHSHGFGGPDVFTCCTGTGVESFNKLADGAFFESIEAADTVLEAADATAHPGRDESRQARSIAKPPPGERQGARNGSLALWVSQFIPSLVRWRGADVNLSSWLERDCRSVRVALTLSQSTANSSSVAGVGVGSVGVGGGGGGGSRAVGADDCFSAQGCTIWLRLPSWADPERSSVSVRGERDPTEPPNGHGQMRVGRFLALHRSWVPGGGIDARFGLYAYLEPVNDWRPQYARSYALLYGPRMMVLLTQGDEHTISYATPEAVAEMSVTECAPEQAGDVGALWAKVRLAAHGRGRVRDHLMMPLSAVVSEQYSSFVTLALNQPPTD